MIRHTAVVLVICLWCIQAVAEDTPDMPVTLSWTTNVSEAVKIADVPSFRYLRSHDAKLEPVEILAKWDVETQDRFGQKKIQTHSMADSTNLLKLEQEGIVESKTWTWLFDVYINFYKPKGVANIRVALFKARTGKDLPTERVSNWISVSVKF